MSQRKASFPPAVTPDARLLILGSLPGERSLAEQRYYAHPQNRFWHLVGKVLDRDLVTLCYPDRLESLHHHHIGLWDVIATARRTGSLDSAIRNAELNPLADLIGGLPHLRAVAFNGRKAAQTGSTLLEGTTITQIALPSSSPAYAAMPLATKEEHWLQLREFLETDSAEAH